MVLICLLTGVFEEGVFRVVALGALGQKRTVPILSSAVTSSVLFGVLHVSVADAVAAGSVVAWAQCVLKPLQAGLFGFFMVALYVRTRSLWTIAGMHALYNLLYLGPGLMVNGISLTYITGNPADLAVLIASTLLLVPPALAAARALRHGTAPLAKSA